jgi:hypothetical protein
MKVILSTVFLFILAPVTMPSAALADLRCYDLSKREPKTLTGMLNVAIFPGPPNYEDVQKGDTPEPGYILRLSDNICITGDDFADEDQQFNEVHLFADTELVYRELNKLDNQRVFVRIADSFAAHDPPPQKWSDLKYVLWHQGGSEHAKEEAHA